MLIAGGEIRPFLERPLKIMLHERDQRVANAILEDDRTRTFWMTEYGLVKLMRRTMTLWPHEVARPKGAHRLLEAMQATELSTARPNDDAVDALVFPIDLDETCTLATVWDSGLNVRVAMPYARFIEAVTEYLRAKKRLCTHFADKYGGDNVFRMIWGDVMLVLDGQPAQYPHTSGLGPPDSAER